MNKGILAAILVGALTVTFFVTRKAAQAVKHFTYKIGKVKFDLSKSAGELFTTLYFNVEIIITNSVNIPITIDNADIDFYIDNTKIGNISNFLGVRIQPNTSTRVNTFLKVSSTNLSNEIINAIKTKNIALKFRYDGIITSGAIEVKVNDTIKVI
jgi:LEA14-like dessication related protein